MKTNLFKCDSCEQIVEQFNDSLPTSWNLAVVYLNWWERPCFLLCGKCSNEMHRWSFVKSTLHKITGVFK